MRTIHSLAAALTLLLPGCSREADNPPDQLKGAGGVAAPGVSNAQVEARPGERWELQSSDEGPVLALLSASAQPTIRLYCPSDQRRLLVNVPSFEPVGSEERLSIGSGGKSAVLVADTRGDARRGGITGSGEVPANLDELIAGSLAINYGAQNSGPHPAPPADLARSFVTACTGDAAPAGQSAPPTTSAGPGPCLMQGSERLRVAPLRAVGTEPFWGARIEGRCVTYSHPDDQAGTRVWTRYTPGESGGTWSGALNGLRFELRTRRAPGCSDGMSDMRYPLAVDLLVGNERRQGCAAPL